jgi:hypothetical protein
MVRRRPGPAPKGKAPDAVQEEEAAYLQQLVDAYGERKGSPFAAVDTALADPLFADHLRDQRTRYFDAASFKRYYRDNTPEEDLITLEDDIYHGVIDTHRRHHPDTLARIDEVMSQAARLHVSGVLGRHARTPVRQGVCHHFANEGRLQWKG